MMKLLFYFYWYLKHRLTTPGQTTIPIPLVLVILVSVRVLVWTSECPTGSFRVVLVDLLQKISIISSTDTLTVCWCQWFRISDDWIWCWSWSKIRTSIH